MVRDMGCDQRFFLRHIESQFTAGMTMENYGKLWHLDHIYPLSKADLTDRVQFLAAANWRNLRPMLGPENVEKRDTITPEGQALFDLLCREFSHEREIA
jgi:DNA-binding helix-hairpin-helix protein with protein kinase domain